MADVKLANQHNNHGNDAINKGNSNPALAFMTGLSKNVLTGVNNEPSNKPQPKQTSEVMEDKPVNEVKSNGLDNVQNSNNHQTAPINNGFPSKVQNETNYQTQHPQRPIEKLQQPNQNYNGVSSFKDLSAARDDVTYDPYADLQKGRTEE